MMTSCRQVVEQINARLSEVEGGVRHLGLKKYGGGWDVGLGRGRFGKTDSGGAGSTAGRAAAGAAADGGGGGAAGDKAEKQPAKQRWVGSTGRRPRP